MEKEGRIYSLFRSESERFLKGDSKSQKPPTLAHRKIIFLSNNVVPFPSPTLYILKMTSWSNYVDFMKSRGNIDGLMIISAEDGATWCCSPDTFYLREYPAQIAQEDGSEKEEIVNEAASILQYIKDKIPPHGLRINGGKKQQVLRNFKDEETALTVIFGKIAQGGSCIAHAGL